MHHRLQACLARGGKVFKLSFSNLKTPSHLDVHSNYLLARRTCKKGSDFSSNLDRKRLRATRHPFRHYTSLWKVDDLISSMVLRFYGLTSIPLWITIKPQTFPNWHQNCIWRVWLEHCWVSSSQRLTENIFDGWHMPWTSLACLWHTPPLWPLSYPWKTC